MKKAFGNNPEKLAGLYQRDSALGFKTEEDHYNEALMSAQCTQSFKTGGGDAKELQRQ